MKTTTDHIFTSRSDYKSGILEKRSAKKNPFKQFDAWLAEAISETADEANQMILTTATRDGKPSSRIVLLRGYDRKGFIFFTNYNSRKGLEIAENPRGSILFYWSKLERQVRVEGEITKTSRKISSDYFASRPRESRLGAWASAQSEVIADRAALEEKVAALERRFAGKQIPCPGFWGGYILKPESFEFWQVRASRLHDRLRFRKKSSTWKIERLSP